MSHKIDQLLELIRIAEVPHGHPEHDAIRSLKACNQFLNATPNFLFSLVHRLFIDSFVFCADRFLIELRQLLFPDVQGIQDNLGTNLAVSFEKRVGHRNGRGLRSAR